MNQKFGAGVLCLSLVLTVYSNAAWGQPCIVPDNGSGTVDLPPLGVDCGYLSPDDVHAIIDGLPPGTTIRLGAEHSRFGNIITTPGGPLGGEQEQFLSEVLLHMTGTGELTGFSRVINLVNVQVITHTGPRGTGAVQDFDTDMFMMQGQLPPGDPDFDLLQITAGTQFGMPSPGHTTLTRLGPPNSNWQVDSFFDITYRIDFVGAPGGPLAGMSGSTTGTIRMQAGGGADFCCLPTGACQPSPQSQCLSQGGEPLDQCPTSGTCVPPGDDCFFTECGQTSFDFCNDPIPADFFNPGSEPFEGRIVLGGSQTGLPDTVVRRDGAMLLDGPPETIPIELVQLHLTSCQPITVTDGTGLSSLWDVEVDLSPTPAPPGQMTAVRTHPNGGEFDAQFHVLPRFTFTSRTDPLDRGDCAVAGATLQFCDPAGVACTTSGGQSGICTQRPNGCECVVRRVLDFGAEGIPATLFHTTGPSHWVQSLSVPAPQCGPPTNFVPGVQEDPATGEQCCTETCHDNPGGGHKHCTKRCFVCPRGACCDAASNTCGIAQGAADCPGVYMGDGTNCNDSDNDGLADVFELNDCCQPSLPCRSASDPNNPDTDGDGVLDGAELAQGCDPCVPDCGNVGCCLPLGGCANVPTLTVCLSQGGTPLPAGASCQGDIDGDGIDEACFAPPCVECGPGPHWIDVPGCPPGGQGQDTLPSGAVLGIDTNFDCIADTNVIAGGPVTIRKAGNFDDSTFYPGTRPIDGHLDVIDTEIIAMSLTGGGVTLKAGTFSGSSQPLQPSRGSVAEQPGNPNLADSFFDVFFEIDLGGGSFAYNHVPIRVAQIIDCMPPKDNYHHLGGCTPLFSSPTGGVPIGNLVQANHFTYPSCCSTAFPGGCANNIPVSQCQGTPVPNCLGDGNGNGQDDACDPQCDRDPTSLSGCSPTCPDPLGPNDQCLPANAGCNPNEPGSCGVLECECQDPNVCHLEKNLATGAYECIGGCPVPPGGTCTLLGDGAFDNPFRCDCVGTPGCVPNASATDCEPAVCPGPVPPTDECHKKCVKIDAAGNVEVTDCECEPATNCHVEIHQGPVPRPGMEGGIAGGGNGCIVPDDGGTVDLPPVGCDYLSPDEVHMIVDGLPPGTTINLAPIHRDFICHKQQTGVCSFPLNVDCEEAGGTLGGEKECASSTIQFDAVCVGPGCNGFGPRTIQIPLAFETHVAPRTVGDPVQSFDTDMFRMFGQITGDPDFDLLRVVGGTDFGLPSPGHTTLTRLPGGNWAVDSFFDITYRIDFVGNPNGPLAGMSGSTTATIRMQTTPPVKCEGDCPAGTTCEQTNVLQADGTHKICCDCVDIPPTECEPNAAGTDCNPVECPPDPLGLAQICRKKCVNIDVNGNMTVVDCNCQPDTDCYLELSASVPRDGGSNEMEGGVAGGPSGCFEPDAGGTVVLPPPGLDCPYVSPDNFHQIVDGLPAGTTIQVGVEHSRFVNINNQPGGSLGGEKENFDSTITLNMNGQCSGPPNPLCGYSRTIQMVNIPCETHIGPRVLGDPVQSFDTEMFLMQGQLPPGDPDFDLLRVTAGSGLGMPSPGHTTLTLMPDGQWAVDSFFDITYRIDYIGAPGGPFGGMSGSTTGTIRMAVPSAFKCRGDCPPGTECVQTSTPEADGSKRICCECVEVEPLGACCQDDGTCVNTTQADCQGTFLPGQLCSGSVEACCDQSGDSCTMQDRVCCLASGGTPMGTGTNCSGIETACCVPGGAGPQCFMADPLCCENAGGIPVTGAQCTGDVQGCCLPSGLCEETDPVCCLANGGTPLGSGNHCAGDLDGNGTDDACERCEPNPTGTGCTNFCPPSPTEDACAQRCARIDPDTQEVTITACDCRRDTECHLIYQNANGARSDGGIVAGGADACIVPDDGSGTVTLPPPGCDYLSPDEVHMIVDGLPPGTTLNLAPIHTQIFCREQNSVCSFPPGVDCTETGGSLGGEKECNSSTLQFQASCAGTCPGGLAGWNRTIVIPDLGFETHTAPRTPGHGVQSFDTQMFRMFGQITGDPDFDLLRVTAGTDFGMPSPGHTTLTRLGPPGSNWAVDSFFDITYRIDFVGSPTGPLAGMSGSTTATIRMQTKAPFKCVGGCGPRRSCTPRVGYNADGTVNVCCDCRPKRPLGDPTLVNKSRFVSLAIDTSAVALGGAEENAIRVRMVSLHHVDPPYTGGPSVPFTAFEGQVRYAGQPSVYLESVSGDDRFVASHLVCAPFYRDWTTFNSCSLTPTLCTDDGDCPMGGTCTVPIAPLLHLTGSAITPSSTFEVEILSSSCVGVEDTCEDVSDPLELKTTRWGDVELPYNPPSATIQPDLADVSALVNKFRNAPGAPIKARALLVGGDLFGEISIGPEFSFIHIAACVDAFRGRPYPHEIQACP